MTDEPLYLVFGLWTEARAFQRDNGLPDADVLCASQHHAALAAVEVTEQRIVLVRTRTPFTEYERPSWLKLSTLARARNEQNDFISEVMNV